MKKSSNFSDQSNIESRKVKLLIIFMLLALMGPTHAGWFGPNNYDDCILENMKGVTQIQAIHAVKSSCRSKFPQACYAWQKKVNSLYKIGEVYKGYRFKGGDPADLKNWDRPAGVLDEWDAKYGRGKVKEASSGGVFDELDAKYGVTVYRVGGVYKGYRYKGGGARDKRNWEPVQDDGYSALVRPDNPAPEGCDAVLSK